MDRRVAILTTLAAVVVLAGCAGLASDGDGTPAPTETPTATPTPTATATPTATGTATSGTGTLPEGWTATGPENASLALQAHYRAVLTGPPTTITYRAGVIQSSQDGATNSSLAMELETRAQRVHARLDRAAGTRELYFANGTISQWSVAEQRILDRSEARYVVVAQSIDRTALKSQLLLYTLEANGTLDGGGTTATVYDVTGVQPNAVSKQYGSPESATGQIAVTESGRVVRVATRVTYSKATVEYSYAQTTVGGTTVERPDWLEDA